MACTRKLNPTAEKYEPCPELPNEANVIRWLNPEETEMFLLQNKAVRPNPCIDFIIQFCAKKNVDCVLVPARLGQALYSYLYTHDSVKRAYRVAARQVNKQWGLYRIDSSVYKTHFLSTPFGSGRKK